MTIFSRSNDCPYCGTGHSNQCYVVYHDGDYCFSCGRGNSVSVFRNADYYAYKQTGSVQQETSGVPEYADTDWNIMQLDVREWLTQFYVDDGLWRKHKMAHYKDSVFYPVGENEYQRRWISPKKFYSSPNLHKHLNIIGNINKNNSILCVVEDYISAIRIAQFYPCLCLFGTKINKEIELQQILLKFNVIIIWLDNDNPGMSAAEKLKIKFYEHLYPYIYRPFNIHNITGEQQSPKELTNAEIKRIITLRRTLDH